MAQPTVQLNFRIQFELYEKLVQYAEENNISRTEAVKRAIEKLVETKNTSNLSLK